MSWTPHFVNEKRETYRRESRYQGNILEKEGLATTFRQANISCLTLGWVRPCRQPGVFLRDLIDFFIYVKAQTEGHTQCLLDRPQIYMSSHGIQLNKLTGCFPSQLSPNRWFLLRIIKCIILLKKNGRIALDYCPKVLHLETPNCPRARGSFPAAGK